MLLFKSNPTIPYEKPIKSQSNMGLLELKKYKRNRSMWNQGLVTKVFDTPQKLKSGLDRWFNNTASTYLECEECAFSYRLAIENQIPPRNIIVSAKGGEKIKSLSGQLKKVSLPLGHLPEYVLVSFTGGDICSMSMENTTASEKYTQYYQEMKKQLEESIKKIKPSHKGTHIIIIAAADVNNLVGNEDILSKSVNYFPKGDAGEKVTCEDIRLGKPTFSDELNGMCPYLLNTSPFDEERVNHIGNLHGAVVDAQRDVVRHFNQAQPKGF